MMKKKKRERERKKGGRENWAEGGERERENGPTVV